MEMKRTMSHWVVIVVSAIIAVLLCTAGSAYALTLVAVDDTYGVPFSQPLSVEAFGVLDNDTLNGQPAGENGATAELITDVSHGTLVLNLDGSFTYTPGVGFPGIDTFTYQAVFNAITSQATVTLTACSTGPTIYTCWKEMPFLAKVAELGYSTFQEGFENEAAWGTAREPNTAPSINSQGIVWETNHPATNEITTGSGPARTGQWGVYDPDHGYATGTPTECDITNPPEYCLFKDGFTGTREAGATTLYGVGGHFTGSAEPSLVMILDGTTQIGLGRLPIGGHHFFGVIDTSGFTTFRVEETDGKVGQERLIFADDFTFAKHILPVPDIKANDSDGPVGITPGEILSVTIELDPGIHTGVKADWWVVVNTPFGWYSYDASTKRWSKGRLVSYQGPVFALSPPREVLNMSNLWIGNYIFHFGVDGTMDGKLNAPLYYDSVEVTISAP